MGQNVTRTQAGEHLLVARRAVVDVRHQRHADLLGDLKRDVERHDPEVPEAWRPTRTLIPTIRSRLASATLTASIGFISRISSLSPTITRCEKAKNAGVRDMQISEDADLARFDHMLAKPCEIARAGAAGVDAVVTPEVRQNSSASMPSEVPPNRRGCADRSGRGDDVTRNVAHVGSRIDLELVTNHDHLAGGEGRHPPRH